MKASDIVIKIREAQGTQRDMRSNVREAHNFVDKKDGQWEPDIITKMRGKPRYTDDRTNPIINQIAGEMENAEFSIKVRPAGGDATLALANMRDGLIRNIRNLSDADSIFAQAGRKMIKGGFSAWLVTNDYYDSESFDQDLMVESIHDAHARVWLDPGDLSNDGSEARWGVVLHYISKDHAAEDFPGKSLVSIGNDSWNNAYYYKPDAVTIGHYYWLKKEKSTVLLMSDGKVLRADQGTESVLDELAAAGITVEDSREVTRDVCCFRMLDANGWISEEQKTVFDSIPIIPCYGNFEVAEGKIIYRGAVEKLMDMQRVHNYAVSRNVEEVALAPRKKIFMTKGQARGHEESIRTMNTNMEPVQFYNAQGAVPPPYEGGASSPNAAVQLLIQSSDESISRSAGMFAANMGANTNLQSGVAIEKQIDRGNNGTSVYFEAMETAIRRTGIVLNKAIPYVYDATRQVRLLKEDGTIEMIMMNNVVTDEQSGQDVTLNDLTQGKYDVVCDIGPAYKNRQQESSEMFLRAMERDPSLIQVAGDIWLKNINAPGFDKIAERMRSIALNNGVIPIEQMTEDERAAAQEAANKPQEPSVEEMAMKIEQMKAETALMAQQNQATSHQIAMKEMEVKYMGQQEKLQSDLAVDGAKIQQTQERIELEAKRVELEAARDQFNQMAAMIRMQNEKMQAMGNLLVDIKNAMGADVIVNSAAAKAFNQTAENIIE